MKPVELALISDYTKAKQQNKLSVQGIQDAKEAYRNILRSLHESQKSTDSAEARCDAFKIEMLDKGWMPDDMPLMEKVFMAVEETKRPDVKKNGMELLESLKANTVSSLFEKSDAIAKMDEVLSGAEPRLFVPLSRMILETFRKKNSVIEYSKDETLRKQQHSVFDPYHVSPKKDKNEEQKEKTEELRQRGYEHNLRNERDKQKLRNKEKYVLPELTQQELQTHKRNKTQKRIKAEMSQRKAMKQVFGKEVYDRIDSCYKGDEANRTVDIHHSRGSKQFERGEHVLELDFAGTGYSLPRREHHGLHGLESGEAKKDKELAKYLDAQYGHRVLQVGETDTSDHHLRMKVRKRAANSLAADGKKRYAFPGPSADHIKLLDMGSYSITKNSKLALQLGIDFLKPLMEKWKNDPKNPENNKPVHINITGHSRGGIAASETVALINDWLAEQKGYEDFAKNVQFDLIQRDPVPGPDVTDERRRHPDFRKYPNVNVTTIYTTAADPDYFGLLFHPQKTRGQRRIIIGTTPHSAGTDGTDKSQLGVEGDGMAHQWGYFDAANKQYYRGSGISELPDGVYLSDEKRNLIRVTRYSQVDQVMNLVNQKTKILANNEARQHNLREVVRNWFLDNASSLHYDSEEQRRKDLEQAEENMSVIADSSDPKYAKLQSLIADYRNEQDPKEKAKAKEQLLNGCREYIKNTEIGSVNKKKENNPEVLTENKMYNAVADLYCQLQTEKNWQRDRQAERIKNEPSADHCNHFLDRLNTKHRFSISHKDSQEIINLRERLTELKALIENTPSPVTDSEQVREKMVEVFETNRAYRQKLRKEANVSDSDSKWQPASKMGRERWQASNDIDAYMKKYVMDDILKKANAEEKQALKDMEKKQNSQEISKDSVAGKVMAETQKELESAFGDFSQDFPAKNIEDQLAKVIAVRTVAQQYQKDLKTLKKDAPPRDVEKDTAKFRSAVGAMQKEIKKRADFQEMIKDKSAYKMYTTAKFRSGSRLMEELSKTREVIIRRDTEQVNAELAKNKSEKGPAGPRKKAEGPKLD